MLRGVPRVREDNIFKRAELFGERSDVTADIVFQKMAYKEEPVRTERIAEGE